MDITTVMPSRQSRRERGVLSGLGQTEDDYSFEYDLYSDPGITPPAATAPQSSWADYLTKAAQIYTEYDLQKEVLDINLQRARQGLPPLDLSQYGAGVKVGLSPATQNTLLIAVAVLAGAMFLPKLMKGR